MLKIIPAPFLLLGCLPTLGLAQEALQRFQVPLVIGDSSEQFQELQDLDADGDLDLLGWFSKPGTQFARRVLARFNNGAGVFAPGWEFEIDFGFPGGTELLTCDLDGDGQDDDFVARVDSGLRLYQGNGTQLPSLYATHTLPFSATNLVCADFNADGRDDIAFGSTTIQIMLNNGAGQALVLGDEFPTLTTWPFFSLAVVDANADGRPDLMHSTNVLGGGTQFHLIVAGQEVAAPLVTHPVVALTVLDPVLHAAGDVDNDGDEDVVVSSNFGNYLLLRRIGASAFQAEPLAVAGPMSDLIDVNGDGFLDGVDCRGVGQITAENNLTGDFRISLNNGSGRFATAFKIACLGPQRLAGAGDVDGDGDVDLAAGRVVYYARGPIGAAPTQALPFATPASSIDPSVFSPIDVVDFDRDGDPDLRLTSAGVKSNPGDGKLEQIAWAPVPPPPGIGFLNGPGYPGDWDGDGDVDLICAGYNGFALQSMRLIKNNGSGLLADAGPAAASGLAMGIGQQVFDVNPIPLGALAKDLDNDGDLDLALPYTGLPGDVRLFWNNGQGFFSAGPITTLEFIETAADLNGDGFPELIGHQLNALAGEYQVAIAYSNGPQNFLPAVLAPGFFAIARDDGIAVLDFEGDGDLDLVTQVGGVLGLLRNDGTGQLALDLTTLRVDPISGANLYLEDDSFPSRFLVSADVDGNGTLDLVAGPMNAALNASYVVLLDGQGGFSSSAQVLLASSLNDLDGDGDLEALGQFVFWNNTEPNPGSGERQQYGASGPLACAARPVLGATGPFRVGVQKTLRVSGVPTGSSGLLAVGLIPAGLSDFPWPGITTHVWPWVGLVPLPPAVGAGASAGDGLSTASFTIQPNWPNFGDVYQQAFFIDPCSPVLVTASNGLRIRYAP